MNAFTLATVAGFAFLGAVQPIVAQHYGGYGARDREYRDDDRGDRRDSRDEDREDRRRGNGRDARDDRRQGRDDRRDGGGISFDEAEYLRCNPDVRRAVASRQIESGRRHFETFGRREGRKLAC